MSKLTLGAIASILQFHCNSTRKPSSGNSLRSTTWGDDSTSLLALLALLASLLRFLDLGGNAILECGYPAIPIQTNGFALYQYKKEKKDRIFP